MWETSPREVLVGVESTDCEAALVFAVEEARLRRCGLHLVHVAPLVTDGGGEPGGSTALSYDDAHRTGMALLGEIAARLRRELRDDTLSVTTELCRGAVVPMLVAESAQACVVVVQHHREDTDIDNPTPSRSEGIAARAHALVAVVPADWRAPPPIRNPVVTVGLPDADSATEVARAAFEYADGVGARLHVVHVCGSQRAQPGRFDVAAVARRRRGQLMTTLSGLHSEHPEVPIYITVTWGAPADALLRAADGSSLLVLGRRPQRPPLSPHLGPVARTVLRRSPVPVLVVEPAPEAGRRAGSTSLAEAAIP
jgi:nucleotide-binding universal stress UspA family protein